MLGRRAIFGRGLSPTPQSSSRSSCAAKGWPAKAPSTSSFALHRAKSPPTESPPFLGTSESAWFLEHHEWGVRVLRMWPLELRTGWNGSKIRALFWVQFDAVAMDPKEPILSFAKRAVELAESLPMKRFVIDLRNNGGGNNFLPRRFADYLSESDTINQDGRLFALIGRRTFSAAINFASMLEMRTKVVFAGEPTPEAPNAFGDAELLELPHSRLRVRISSLSWQSSIVEDTRPGIDPQIPVMPTYAQFRAREDPVFDAVLLYEAEPKIEVPARTRRRLSRKLTGAYRFRGRPARILDLEGRLWLEIDAPERRSFFEVRSELVPAGAAILQTDVEGVVLRLENDRVIVDWRGTRIPLEPARN